MSAEGIKQMDGCDLKETIERQIEQRTWGRIHRLHVESSGGRLIVHGCTSSYYSKQLALEAALEVLGWTENTQVELDIEVGGLHPRRTRSHELAAAVPEGPDPHVSAWRLSPPAA
jgi:hypothetical protein